MDKNLQTTVLTLLRVIPIVIHLLGIYLLLTVRFIRRWQRIQSRYHLWLSCVEIMANLTAITQLYVHNNKDVSFHLMLFHIGFLDIQIVLVLLALTMDRAAFVWLNMKYESKMVGRAVKFVFVLIFVLAITSALCFAFTQNLNSNLARKVTLYIYPIMDICLLTTFFVCYGFIIRTVHKRSRKLFGIASQLYQNRMRNATFVPKLVVICSVSFWATVNAVYFGFEITGKDMPQWLEMFLSVFKCLAYSTDALLYILFIHSIRQRLKQIFCCVDGTTMSPNRRHISTIMVNRTITGNDSPIKIRLEQEKSNSTNSKNGEVWI